LEFKVIIVAKMNVPYDQIGKGYSINRKSDPKIAKQIYSKLVGAKKILNIGAGSGSYEPANIDLIAVEPSAEMIAQRAENAHPVFQAFAEELPFESNSFSHSMTVLSMHHWTDRNQAFDEIKRVTTDTFVAITWDPSSNPFWLTRDYFPEIYETDKNIFPSITDFKSHFYDVQVSPLWIPDDCQDGFLAAFWKRPEAYLNEEIRKSISTFSYLKELESGLNNLEKDLNNGDWKNNNQSILNSSELDAGYVIVSAKVAPSD